MKLFTKGSWTVLTQDTGERGIEWRHIEDDSISAPGGGAISQNQIDAICEEVLRLQRSNFLGSWESLRPSAESEPFRDSFHALLPNDFIVNSQLLVDTADGFQGDERDLVLFSLVAGDSLPEGSMNFLLLDRIDSMLRSASPTAVACVRRLGLGTQLEDSKYQDAS